MATITPPKLPTIAEINEQIKLPQSAEIDLLDGRTIKITGWHPSVVVGELTSIEIVGCIVPTEPKE
jgi:hypothetical protein